MGKRLFLLDHCCVHKYFGHHASSLHLFKAYFNAYFRDIITLVPETYDDLTEGFERDLICPYPRISFFSSNQIKAEKKGVARRLRTSWAKRSARREGIDGMRKRMLQNVAALDRKYGFTRNDLLLFPNGEPFGVIAFCNYFSDRPAQQRPRLHFRMIAVQDAEAVPHDDPIAVVAGHVAQAKQMGTDVQMSCETPKYLDELQSVLPDAFLMPYPFNAWCHPETKTSNAIGCIGQGRWDKGYFRIATIAEKVAQTHPNAEWIVQSMRETDGRYSIEYQQKLSAMANIRIAPGFLSNHAIDALYAKARFSVLPYHEETYRLRGSAVLQEALAHGQLCIAPSGTGISSAVAFFGNGLVARSDEEFAAAVGTLLDMPRQDYMDRVKQAQSRYDEVIRQAVPKILSA